MSDDYGDGYGEALGRYAGYQSDPEGMAEYDRPWSFDDFINARARHLEREVLTELTRDRQQRWHDKVFKRYHR